MGSGHSNHATWSPLHAPSNVTTQYRKSGVARAPRPLACEAYEEEQEAAESAESGLQAKPEES
jgi:hypothetical protein